MKVRAVFIAVFLACMSPGQLLRGADWPQWRGPTEDCVWRETGILEAFPADGLEVRWRQKIGSGYAGPAVAGGYVFVADRVLDPDAREKAFPEKNTRNHHYLRKIREGKERLLCLRESDGAILWTHQYECTYTTARAYATGPRCTPCVDEGKVYHLGAEGNLLCLNVQSGEVVWSKDFNDIPSFSVPTWGTSSHPYIDGETLFCIVGGEGTAVMAFDKRTGQERWRRLSSKAHGYSAPMIYTIHGQRQLVAWLAESINALDPETGDVSWSQPVKTYAGMAIGVPTLHDDSLFIMGFGGVSMALVPAADNRSVSVGWTGDRDKGVCGVFTPPMIHQGYIYAAGDSGILRCVDSRTGQRLWSTYDATAGGRKASWGNIFIVRNGEKFFLVNDAGQIILARMDEKGLTELSRAQLIEPDTKLGSRLVNWSHPAFANRGIYARNDKEIICASLSAE